MYGDIPNTTIASLIRGDFVEDWVRKKLAESAAKSAAAAMCTLTPPIVRRESSPAMNSSSTIAKNPFKMKKFGKVKSKVAAMGYF
jgi:hypothetical protein